MAYGRRPPKNARALPFAAVREALAVLAYPPSSDSTKDLESWEMLWNDSWGDCVVVTWSSIRRIVTSLYTAEEYVTDRASILALYRTQNPNFDPDNPARGPGTGYDGGMDIQTLLEYLVTHGGPDGVKALAFAKVDHTNEDEVKAALSIFKTLWMGVVVTGDDEREFPNLVWTRTGQALGGHSITGTGYEPNCYRMQTWGDEGLLANDYVLKGNSRAGVEEAWVVIWPEHGARLDNVQKQQLDDQFYQLTGRHIAWGDTPAPTPTPSDLPQEILDWLEKTPRYYKKIWADLRKYLGM